MDLQKGELHVRQRADRYGKIGPPRSEAGRRTIPLIPELVTELKAWKLKCPRQEGRKLHYVFPTNTGHIQHHVNIVERGFKPTLIAGSINRTTA